MSSHPNVHLINSENCGHFVGDRIINGNTTNWYDFPWMAIIQYQTRMYNIILVDLNTKILKSNLL